MTVYEKIKEQQPTEENDVWMVGEQLADICRAEGAAVEAMVLEDLKQNGMGLKDAAAKIRELANQKHKKSKGSCVVITQAEAEEVIRKFYGIGKRDEAKTPNEGASRKSDDVVDLFDMI